MRLFLILILCFLVVGFAEAQDSTNYQIALQRIEEARVSGASELSLDTLSLSSLPPEIGSLSQLESLNLNYNSLTTLPPEIGNLSNLHTLVIQSNALTSLPPEIGNLSSLGLLYLTSNQLETLPPEIGNLVQLRNLRVDYNNLSSLPPEIGNLSNLRELLLDRNNLISLPDEMGNLRALCRLGLAANQLRSLPAGLAEISPLRSFRGCEMRIYENPIAPPEMIQNEGNASILDYINNPKLWMAQRFLYASAFWIVCAFLFYLWIRPQNKAFRKSFISSDWSLLWMVIFYFAMAASAVLLRIAVFGVLGTIFIYPLVALIYLVWHNFKHGFKPLSLLVIPVIVVIAFFTLAYFFECRMGAYPWLIGFPVEANIRCG